MSIKITMPALSPTMTEGTLSSWLVAEGDSVVSGQVIAEIETDKATMEVEAVDEGIIAKIVIDANTPNVAVNSVIALLAEEGEDVIEVAKESVESSAPVATPAPTPTVSKPAPVNVAPTAPVQSSPVQSSPAQGRIFASPLAKRIAEQKGLNLSNITGSGPKGRIIKMDVENAKVGGMPSMSATAPARPTPFEPAYTEIPVSTMRSVIAKRLCQSKQEVPHFYVSADVEIDKLLSARKYLNDIADGAYKVSVNDMVLKAVAVALRKVPEANVSWAETMVKAYSAVDVSVAVAIEGGLITPIIRNADYKSLVEISTEMKELAGKAKSGSLTPEQFQGGTVSVSNLGMFGVKQFNAIVNPPQACIVAVGAGMQKPIVKDGQLAVGTVMNLTISADHRAVDGAVAAQFLSAIKEALEEPVALMM